jgi:hypothetical protein
MPYRQSEADAWEMRWPPQFSTANVILEAVDELVEKKMDKKLDEKFNPVITKLDAVLKEFEDHRDEDIAGAEQLRRHDDQLQDHTVRIKNSKRSAIHN